MKILKYILLFCAGTAASYFAFILSPPAQGLGESSRILYLHVPVAWMAVLAFGISGISAFLFILKAKKGYALMMNSGALLGIIFILGAVTSGAVWAHTAWGVFWNWDPRETSVAILLLIYMGYFSIPSRSRISKTARAGYLVISAVLMPVFIFVFPRIFPSLHPSPIINTEGSLDLGPLMRTALFTSLFAYTILFCFLYRITYRILKIRNTLEKKQ